MRFFVGLWIFREYFAVLRVFCLFCVALVRFGAFWLVIVAVYRGF